MGTWKPKYGVIRLLPLKLGKPGKPPIPEPNIDDIAGFMFPGTFCDLVIPCTPLPPGSPLANPPEKERKNNKSINSRLNKAQLQRWLHKGYTPLMSLSRGSNANFSKFNELWSFYLKFKQKKTIHHLQAACVY